MKNYLTDRPAVNVSTYLCNPPLRVHLWQANTQSNFIALEADKLTGRHADSKIVM